MATDTPTAPAPPAPAAVEAPPPAALPQPQQRGRAAPDPALGGLSPAEVRRNAFVQAFAKPEELEPEAPFAAATAAAAAAAAPKEAPPAPAPAAKPAAKVDTPAKKADTGTTQVQTGAPPEASPASTKSSAAEASAPADGTTPATPSAATPQPAPSGSTDATAGQAPKPATPSLPEEYQTPEHERLYKADPLLKRTVNSLWNDPNLSPIAKVQKIDAKIGQSKDKLTQAHARAEEEDRLWDEGDFDTLRQRQLARREQRTLTVEAERTVTTLLAQALGVDPDDEGFLGAGSDAETTDERFRAFGDYVARHSPVARDVMAEREAALSQQHTATVEQLKAQFAEEKATLEATFKDTLATEVEKARSQARAGNPPPRGNTTLAPADTYVRPVAPTIRSARDLIAAGIEAREAASGR